MCPWQKAYCPYGFSLFGGPGKQNWEIGWYSGERCIVDENFELVESVR